MSVTAVVKSGADLVHAGTGEVVGSTTFSMVDYLASVNTPAAFETQKRLAAAYDAACLSLIGENDVQKEGARTFKKKSAWRKLARHFSISTVVVRVEREFFGEGDFLAMVTVKALGPWGQSAEAVGACGTDEETGKRKITIADAIATAETRATNRATSNLIAMGEVSAEEIGDRESHAGSRGAGTGTAAANTASAGAAKPPEEMRMPFGRTKGSLLGDLETDDLQSAAAWCREKGKFLDVAEACETVVRNRGEGASPGRGDLSAEPEDDDDLPF